MDNIQRDIDERANLALTNKFELLLFRLGVNAAKETAELYGINVFKLREIVPMPEITKAAGMVSPLLGMTSIRGQIIPVIDLAAVAGCVPESGHNLLLVTEYARSTQAFAIESVDDIVRLEWRQVHQAEIALNAKYVTSIASLEGISGDEKGLVQILDVEQVLHEIIPSIREVDDDSVVQDRTINIKPGSCVIVAEDSKVARQMLEKAMRVMKLPAIMHATGLEAWKHIQQIARESLESGRPVSDKIALVLTDLEMPEMDGFTLTRSIKGDKVLAGIPVIIHSSLTGSANEEHIRKVRADGYVAKFEINELFTAIKGVLQR
ncbi:chemotaxis protein CheV [Erwinia sp. OLTSP20]|uniref:chemotaxis protein n=1 Tax=unclassified Erwinia TaxID=2622719 RepID=UPI000C17922B|nr:MULTISPECIES: chemotaxis protein [unclassified Erwinia]PIJ51128.1 chemotaxis protein CheV [Erwinia sp. OAMSP11]PIJ73880.1 chemotaxis protein CheV [Erwinia sp. OLSSP12]PIJ78388.1 chemotaxis protein CheV [Erwinia sp. OLCASP19]PIJ86418.1 chemotaxis protein CheV [Erwinia sp. OLMTSP26]PIJ87897.1 chemotaxis protein CheV [Erwinia sp. OLMDSP33]